MESVAGRSGLRGTFDAHTPYEVFDREHRVLREGVMGLRSALLSDHPGSTRLVEHLDTVRAQLAVHFAFEEDDGFMHYLRIARPVLAPGIDRLQSEHKEILAVLTSVSAGLSNGLSCADVRATVTSVLEHLANHELDERELLRAALLSG
jgi:hemerythrin